MVNLEENAAAVIDDRFPVEAAGQWFNECVLNLN